MIYIVLIDAPTLANEPPHAKNLDNGSEKETE